MRKDRLARGPVTRKGIRTSVLRIALAVVGKDLHFAVRGDGLTVAKAVLLGDNAGAFD